MKKGITIIISVCVLCAGIGFIVIFHGNEENFELSQEEIGSTDGQQELEGSPKGSEEQNIGESKHNSSSHKNGRHSFKQRAGARVVLEDGTYKVDNDKDLTIKPIDLETGIDKDEIENKINASIVEICSIPADAQDYIRQIDEIRLSLGEISAKELTVAFNNLIASEKDEGKRLDALRAMNALVFDERFLDELSENDVEEIKSIMRKVVDSGLKDSNDDIRHLSFDMLERLPKDIGQSLYGCILSGEYSDVKEELLQKHSGSEDFQELALFFQALDVEDTNIVQLAHDNIYNVLGQEFKSSEEAFEWWEKNNQ